MGLIGKLIAAIEFKAGGDVFNELIRHNPHDLSKITPEKVQGCDLHEGQFGHVGTIITWRYTHGKSPMYVTCPFVTKFLAICINANLFIYFLNYIYVFMYVCICRW